MRGREWSGFTGPTIVNEIIKWATLRFTGLVPAANGLLVGRKQGAVDDMVDKSRICEGQEFILYVRALGGRGKAGVERVFRITVLIDKEAGGIHVLLLSSHVMRYSEKREDLD